MITKLSPGQRARLAALGVHPARVGRPFNTAPVVPKNVPVPKNADELAEVLGDPGRLAPVIANKEALGEFIQAYANAQQGDGTELRRQVEAETQRALAAFLKDNEGATDTDSIKRLNLSPQTQPGNMLSSHRQATAYNPKAAGTLLDKEFSNAAEYFSTVWHRSGPEAQAKVARLRNAYSSVVPSEGGFLVPETLRSQLLSIALEQSVVRPRATVIPMETARVPFPMIDSVTNVGSVFGGMVGYWAEESAAFQESNPKFGRIELDAKKLTGFALVPNELLSDSLISFAALIERLWPSALAFFEDSAFTTGSGAGQPLGFLGSRNPASVAITKESGQTAATIKTQNIVKMYSRMLPASLNNAVWLCSPEALPQLLTLSLEVGTGGAPVMLVDASAKPTMTMLGCPLIVTEKAGRVGTRGDLAFVDLSYYLVGDRQLMTADSSTDYRFGNDQTAFRILQRVDGRPWLQSAITPANGGDALSPFVEIEARP